MSGGVKTPTSILSKIGYRFHFKQFILIPKYFLTITIIILAITTLKFQEKLLFFLLDKLIKFCNLCCLVLGLHFTTLLLVQILLDFGAEGFGFCGGGRFVGLMGGQVEDLTVLGVDWHVPEVEFTFWSRLLLCILGSFGILLLLLATFG